MKVYKYEQYFGRMGSLSSVFVASDEDIERLKKRCRVYLGEVLGKHSEVTATADDKTIKVLTDDKAVVSFFVEHLGGRAGTDLLGHMRDQEEDGDE
jgi:hypothetical protein